MTGDPMRQAGLARRLANMAKAPRCGARTRTGSPCRQLRFLRQSHKNMTEEYVSVYGNYANKLLRLQLDLIQALDRHRRGHKQTVEVQHVHLHSGAQGVVGIVNAAGEDHATREGQK